jgi:hypothetical protein
MILTTFSRCVLVMLSALAAFAGDRPVPPIVELARAAPPEFFADAIVKLVQAGKIPQSEQQVELLEEAFSVAAGAKESMRLTGLPGTPPDTREIYRSKAGELGLNTLSLQSRIVRELVTLDRAKARELFERIARPKLEPRPCADPLIADVSAYYEAAAVIAQSTFTDREKESELHVQFLAAQLEGAQSPNELAPYAREIQSVGLSTPEWRLLLAGIAAKLQSIPTDYRPFAMYLDALQSELANLIESGRANQIGVDEVVQSFRKYLVKQLTAARCGPDLAIGLEQVAWLQPPPTEDESKPAKRKESFKVAQTYFESEDSKQIGTALNRLRSAGDDWKHAFSDFLRDFSAWRPDGSDIDVFHQKATVLRALLEITPRGEDRDRVLNLCVAFLQLSPAERQSPAEWLWEAKTLAELANLDTPKLVSQFRNSQSLSLSLYATLNYFGASSGTSK